MPTAELEQTADTVPELVSRPEECTLFMARRSALRLVKLPARDRRGVEGQTIERIPGEVVQFRDGVFRVPFEGDVTLEDGRRVPAAPVLAWLEGHRMLGDVEEGFWKVDPVAPPASDAELEALTDLVTGLDVEGLEAFLAQERAGWRRPQLLRVAERAIQRVASKLEEASQTKDELLAAAREEGRQEALGATESDPGAVKQGK